ncbi:hypothetical protein [Mucilaginibacter rubeus]|uniref:Uncharacterized protein n=1 Tax=Mucilaginibacter rubeus TaxID=2027860 RepID=A0A5C1I073_9SPHI|nr:hypothetical protein [Mucilaginibacter rubeus]QEM10598.1 hypothetical protein DEO27_011395 [Mucilaginibacter rubeus]
MPTQTSAITKRYYPSLSEVITVDDLPEFLSFAQEGLQALLDKIHYKNFQYSKSYRGDAAFYKLDIVTANIGIDLPFGLRFVLNPDENGDENISSFPITLQYQWDILAFLGTFNLKGFSFSPDGFYQLGLQVFKVTDEQVLAHTLNYFVDPADASVSRYQQLIDDINELYPDAHLSLPAGQVPTVSMVAGLIRQNVDIPVSISELMFAAYLLDGNLDQTREKLQQFYNLIVPGGIEDYIQKLIKPWVRASLTLSAGIEFPTTILQPVDNKGNVIPNTRSLFRFAEATFYVDTESGIGSKLELEGSLIPQYNQIGNTGLIIEFTKAKLDLSSKTNIPEADAAGFSPDFMGLYVQQASVTFGGFGQDNPSRPSATIYGRNLLIGTGGISGTIGIDADSGSIHRDFGLFSVELDHFSITFKHNSIVNSAISGKLVIPGFEQNGEVVVILIDAFYQDNGDFKISARPQDGTFPPIRLPNVFELDIRTLEVGSRGGRFYIRTSGKLSFIADLPVLGDVLPKDIEISKLVIWDDGSLEFDGGELLLPASVRLKVGPVNLEVSHMSLGPYSKKLNGIDRRYAFFGFDGMINTGNAGVSASGNGIKYYFTVDNGAGKPFDNFISIDTIAIDLTIPGNVGKDKAAFILEGYLSMRNPDPAISTTAAATEYTGSVTFTAPKLRLSGSAGMRLTPSVPSFVVDVGLELAAPIPLGATGLGIYGFRGLIGQHYMPDKSATNPKLPDSATWWDYYKVPSTITGREGIAIDKFGNRPGYSFGAGMSVATAFDSGFVFSSKLFLLLGLPDVFLIEGQAGILRNRLGLGDDVDPPFSAVIIFGDDSFRSTLSAKYSFPDQGDIKGLILDMRGTLDMAFFFNNASGWYINVGKDSPDSARVQAEILTLFQGYAYLMLSSQGVKAGAGAKFDFNKSFGPVGLGFGASLNIGGFVSFKPVQVGGFIQVAGYAYFKVWKFKFGIAVSATLSVEAPHPFNITGSFKVKLNLPWPIPDIKLTVSLTWHFNDNQDALLAPVAVLQLPDPSTGYQPAAALNILSGETFTLNYVNNENSVTIPPPGNSGWKYNFLVPGESDNVTIPLDSFIDIELLKPVKPVIESLGGTSNQVPEGYSEMIPPQKGINKQVKHEYEMTRLEIYAWNETGSAWVPYHVYEAVTAIVAGNTGTDAIELSRLKDGYWQFAEKNKYNKIRLLSQNMFSYSRGSSQTTADMDARYVQQQDIFCYDTIHRKNVVDWTQVPDGTIYPVGTTFTYKGLEFTLTGTTGTVKFQNGFGAESLCLEGQGILYIRLPEPVLSLRLAFGSNNQDVSVSLMSLLDTPDFYGSTTETTLLRFTITLPAGQQNREVAYDNEDEAVSLIRLEFDPFPPADYLGDWVIGGHLELPDVLVTPEIAALEPGFELEKALLFATLFNRSFSAEEVRGMAYHNQPGTVAEWALDSLHDLSGNINGILSGGPWSNRGYYEKDNGDYLQLHNIYQYEGNADGFVIPYYPALRVENGNFSAGVTTMFDPYTRGVSTLMYKVSQDESSGQRKGFALHLLQSGTVDPEASYTDQAAVPTFTIWLTLYNGANVRKLEASAPYTVDGMTGKLRTKQYKQLLISVNRVSGQLDIYLDRIQCLSTAIPSELQPYLQIAGAAYLNTLSYITEELRKKETDNPGSHEQLITEVDILSDSINKTIQPVWRPNTTFAILIQTQDRVNGQVPGSAMRTHIFGFKTAGPIGHFHQHSTKYHELAMQDRTDSFKLASLKAYIDYNRSFPDAQGRYNLSKPVFCHFPQVKLFFTQPYLNAMYADWDTYKQLPEVQSRLDVQLIDPFGVSLTPSLQWSPVQEVLITDDNVGMLPEDEQTLYYLNKAAAKGACDQMPVPIKKKTRHGFYAFPDLQPNTLYTALFKAVYAPAGISPQSIEVHKFSFKTSRYADLQEQAGSFVLNNAGEPARYAIYRQDVSFSDADVNSKLIPLIHGLTEGAPENVVRYAVPFDRLVYGGLALIAIEPAVNTAIRLVVNTGPGNNQVKRILGLVITSPEPFNDPKLPAASLEDTFKLTIVLSDGSTLNPDAFIRLYAADTSGVFITNEIMDLPVGKMQLSIRYKIFNGIDYETDFQQYDSPAIALEPYLS